MLAMAAAKMKSSRISSKLQVTLPAAFVRGTGMAAGEAVSISVAADGSIRIASAKSALAALAGSVAVPSALRGKGADVVRESRASLFVKRHA